MFLNEEELLSEKKFMAKNPTVKNIKDDLTLLNSKSGNKSQSVKNTNIKTNDNSSKESVNNIEYNTISMPSHENLTNTSESKEFGDSEKEVRGERFYSENKRYIFTDIYSKEIDGVFTKNNQINLEKSKIDIMTGLGDLILKYDDKKGIIEQILNDMCDEGSINDETLAESFINITNIFTDEQKNSSIESIVLCLKSFTKWSIEIKEIIKKIPEEIPAIKSGEEEKPKNKIKTSLEKTDVVMKYYELIKLLYDEDDFKNWYKYINELRLELNKEIDDLETLNEIDPNYVYLYLVNIIINEIRKNYLQKEEI